MTRIAFLIALLIPFAANAATVNIRDGGHLTSTTWPSGTELVLPKGAILFADKPVKWQGKLTINGNGGWIRNRMNAPAATFDMATGQTLVLRNLTLAQAAMLTVKGWNSSRAVIARGGVIEARNVFINDGYGFEIWSCDSFTWIGGGTGKTTTYQYAAYLGNNLADAFADRVYVEGCNFRVGRKETSVRIMGAAATFVQCTFTADTEDGRKHRKGSVQPRHGTIGFIRCKMNSIDAGNLDPSIDGGKHAAYALKHPTTIGIENSTIAGYTEVRGNTTVETKGVTVTPDPRGIGGSAAFNLIAQVYAGQTLAPAGASADTAVFGFSRFASAGWKLIGGNTLNGKLVK